ELPLKPYFGRDEVPAVASDLFLRKSYFPLLFCLGRNCHGRSPLLFSSAIDGCGLYLDPAGDRRHDADRVSVLGSRIFLVQEANVLVIQIYIHEAADSSVVGIEMLAQLGEARRQSAERLAHRGGVTFDARLLSGELAKRRRNQDLNSHTMLPPSQRRGGGFPLALNAPI